MNSEPKHNDDATPPPALENAPVVAIIPSLINSLVELRRQHSVLLQRDHAGAGTAKPSPGEMLGFLISAQKLGRNLEDFDNREIAQGIMDFWVAALLGKAPQAADSNHSFTLDPFDESISHLNTSEACQSRAEAAKVERLVEKISSATQVEALENVKIPWLHKLPLPFKQLALFFSSRNCRARIMERLLQRFVRLKETSIQVYSVPLDRSDGIFSEPNSHKMLERLITAGVVKQQETTNGIISSYVLANEILLTRWDFLVDLVMERRAFRQLAYGWNNGSRQPHALLEGGNLLQDALDYAHVDEIERAFIDASLLKSEHQWRTKLFVLITLVVVLSCLVGGLLKQNSDLMNVTNQLKQSYMEVSDAQNLLVKKQGELKEANTRLERRSAENEEEFKISETKRSQLNSLNEQLAKRPNIPDSVKQLLKYATNSEKTSSLNAKGYVEIFIPLSADNRVMERANEYAAALRKAGFDIPAGIPLPRRSVHIDSSATEVRYFYDADEEKKLADIVRKTLIGVGMPSNKIKVVLIKDRTAPKHFIQISITNTGLSWSPDKR